MGEALGGRLGSAACLRLPGVHPGVGTGVFGQGQLQCQPRLPAQKPSSRQAHWLRHPLFPECGGIFEGRYRASPSTN